MKPTEIEEKLVNKRYLLKEKLGEGGMGQVYLAEDTKLNRPVALKESFKIEDEDVMKAALREAKALAGLKHPNLPAVHDYFDEDDTPYIVMEFISGCDLSSLFVGNDSELSLKLKQTFYSESHLELVSGWLETMFKVVEYLHNQPTPIVHRDIKPSNIIYTANGNLVLIDFGLVKTMPRKGTNFSMSKGILGFSPNYSPLEQHNGEPTSTEADIYAFCATFYHLFTKTKPADVLARLTQIADSKGDPLKLAHLVNPQIPLGISNMLNAGMSIGKDKRPKTIAELRQYTLSSKTEPIGEEHQPFTPGGSSRFYVNFESQPQPSEPQQNQPPIQPGVNPSPPPFMPYYDNNFASQPIAKPRKYWMVWVLLIMLAGSGLGFYLYENSLYGQNKSIVERLTKAAVDDFDTIEKEWGNYESAIKQTSYFKWGLGEVNDSIQKKIDSYADHKIEEYRTGLGKVGKSDDWKRPQQLLQRILANEPNNKEIQANIAYFKGQQDFSMAFAKNADKNTLLNSARKFYEEATRLNPKFGDAYFMIALSHIYGKGRDYTKALENIELASGNGFPFDKRTKAVKGDCLQALADATVDRENARLKAKNVTNIDEAHEFLGELEESLKTIRERYTAAKSLYEEAKGYGTVDKSLKAINTRLEKLDQGIDAVDKLHLLADVLNYAENQNQ